MAHHVKKPLRLAILDLYEGVPNQGMRCIRDILRSYCANGSLEPVVDEFEVRVDKQLPGTDYDVYISSGGPGSPLDSAGSDWEKLYFSWIRQIEQYNKNPANTRKKYVLFICHSFQLACRYFQIGSVARRRSTSFGVFPVHLMHEGKEEDIFNGLADPFYAVDSRDYQVVEPDFNKMKQIGATVLAIEKERPHVPLERAVMAIRFNDNMWGTQFHPEADAEGMTMYLLRNDKKEMVIENHGFDKWQSMIDHLNDPDKIRLTYSQVIPNFLDKALMSGVV